MSRSRQSGSLDLDSLDPVGQFTLSVPTSVVKLPGAPVTATLLVDPTGSNNSLRYTARLAGVLGNDVTIRYVAPGSANGVFSISVSDKAITVNLASDGSNVITTTADSLYTALIANAEVMNLVNVEKVGTTSGTLAAVAATNLAGGAAGFTTDMQTGLSEKTRGMIFSVETNGFRVTFDGTTPSLTNGILVPTGIHYWTNPSYNWNRMLQRAKFISNHNTDPSVVSGVFFELQ